MRSAKTHTGFLLMGVKGIIFHLSAQYYSKWWLPCVCTGRRGGGGGRRAEGSSGGGVGRWVTVSCSSETVQNSQGLFRDDLAPLYIQVIKQMIFNQGRAVVTDVHCWANRFNPGRCSSCCFCYSIYTDMTLNIQWNCTYADDVALFYFSFFLPSFWMKTFFVSAIILL